MQRQVWMAHSDCGWTCGCADKTEILSEHVPYPSASEVMIHELCVALRCLVVKLCRSTGLCTNVIHKKWPEVVSCETDRQATRQTVAEKNKMPQNWTFLSESETKKKIASDFRPKMKNSKKFSRSRSRQTVWETYVVGDNFFWFLRPRSSAYDTIPFESKNRRHYSRR